MLSTSHRYHAIHPLSSHTKMVTLTLAVVFPVMLIVCGRKDWKASNKLFAETSAGRLLKTIDGKVAEDTNVCIKNISENTKIKKLNEAANNCIHRYDFVTSKLNFSVRNCAAEWASASWNTWREQPGSISTRRIPVKRSSKLYFPLASLLSWLVNGFQIPKLFYLKLSTYHGRFTILIAYYWR